MTFSIAPLVKKHKHRNDDVPSLDHSRPMVGSACVSHVGERVLAIADFPPRFTFFVSITVSVKACFGATPLQRLRSNGQASQPARETHALPKAREPRTRRDFQIDGE
jgi:hypothetical protein